MNQGTKQDESFFKDLYQKNLKQIEEKLYTIMKHTEQDSPTSNEAIQFLLDTSFENKKEMKELQQEMIDISQLFKETLWKSYFTLNFLTSLSQRGYNYITILSYLRLILEGYFSPLYPLSRTEQFHAPYQMPFQSFFIQTIQEQKCKILFSVSVFNQIKHNKFIKFKHTVVFLDVKFYETDHEIFETSVFAYLSTTQNDPTKNISKYEIKVDSQLVVQSNTKTIVAEKLLFTYKENAKWPSLEFANDTKFKYCKWIPTLFQRQCLNDYMLCQYKDMNEWKQKLNQQRQIIKQNKAKIDQYANFKDSGIILDLIRNCSQVKEKNKFSLLRITEQERNVVGITSNALIIGRSGTGKTTCSLLRIYSAIFLMNIRLRLYNTTSEQILINSHNTNQNVNLRFVFTTQNQILVSEVRKYYRKLSKYIKKQLTKPNISLDESFSSFGSEAFEAGQDKRFIEVLKMAVNQECQLNQINKSKQFESIDKVKEMVKLTNEDFPAFASIEKILLLIDSSLYKPFFSQDKYQSINQAKQKKAGWKGAKVFRIGSNFMNNNYDVQEEGQDYLLDELIEQMSKKEGNNILDQDNVEQQQYKQQLPQNLIQREQQMDDKPNQNLIDLVMMDFNYFLNNFWPLIKKKCQKQLEKIDAMALPQLIWTQIYSVIKGSQYSYLYPQQCLPFDVYEEKYQNKLSKEQLKTVYEAFLEYEKWKNENDSFDLLDLVNYLLVQIKDGKYNGVPIHYLLVDEIQDLPHAMIELLTCITEQGLFFCGDTAQTIMKGIGFRFQDIKQLFRNQVISGNTKFADVKQLQLSVNFRSHNSILQMANCLVSLIELFFPKQIDHLNQEISNIKGPKPYVVVSQDIRLIIELIGKILDANIEEKNQIGKENRQISFGCNQVIIVKDEDEKEKVNSNLAHALILTIYEAKGLEFEDVILYNFFSNGISQNQWELLKYVTIENYQLSAGEQLQRFSKHDIDSSQQIDNFDQQTQIQKLKLNPQVQAVDLTLYQNLCNELKLIYVGVTRAKRSVIIYDEDPSKRQIIQQLWKLLDIVQLVDHQSIQNINQLEMVDERVQRSKGEWNKMGKKMFANKYYDQAVKCFMNGEDEKWATISKGYAFANKAQKLYSKNILLKNESMEPNINKNRKQKLLSDAQSYFDECVKFYEKAGKEFVECGLLKNAAGCYFSAEEYLTAWKYYLQSDNNMEAAECCKKLKQNTESAILYISIQCYEEGLEQLEKDQDNCFLIIQILITYNQRIKKPLIIQYLNQYFKSYINSYYSIFDKKYQNEKDIFHKKIGKCREQMQSIIDLNKDKNIERLQIFEKVLQDIEEQIVKLKIQKNLVNFMISQISSLQKAMFSIIKRQYCNYNKSKYKRAFQQSQNTITKQHFIEDLLDYFQLYQVMDHMYQCYYIEYKERYLQTQLFKFQEIFKRNTENLIQQGEDEKNMLINTLLGIKKFQVNSIKLLFQTQIQLGFWKVTLKQNKIFQLFYVQNQNFEKYIFNIQEISYLFRHCKSEYCQQNELFKILQLQEYFSKQAFDKQFDSTFKELPLIQNFTLQNKINFKMVDFVLKYQYENKEQDINDKQSKFNKKYFEISICLISIINETMSQLKHNNKQQNLEIDLYTDNLQNLDKESSNNLIMFLKMGSKLFKYKIQQKEQISLFYAFCAQWILNFPRDDISNIFGSSFILVHQCSPLLQKNQSNKNENLTLNQEEIKQGFIISYNPKIFLFPSFIIIKYIKLFCQRFLNMYQKDYIKQKQNKQTDGFRYVIKSYSKLQKKNKNFFILKTYEELIMRDIKLNFIKTNSNQLKEHFDALQQISEWQIKKLFEDSNREKLNKHFLNSCLINRLINNLEQNKIINCIINDKVQNQHLTIKTMVQGYESYIFFQNYMSQGFSLEGVRRYVDYYKCAIKSKTYSFFLSDIIGIVLTLVFHAQSQKYLEEQNMQDEPMNQQQINQDKKMNQSKKMNQMKETYFYSQLVFIPICLKPLISYDNSIIIGNYYIDLEELTLKFCEIILYQFFNQRQNRTHLFQLLQFLMTNLDIHYQTLEIPLEKYINSQKYKERFDQDIDILFKLINMKFQDRGSFIERTNENDFITQYIYIQCEKSCNLNFIYTYFTKKAKDQKLIHFQELIEGCKRATQFSNLYYAMNYLLKSTVYDNLSEINYKEHQLNQIIFETYLFIDQFRMFWYKLLYSPIYNTNSIDYQTFLYQIMQLQKQEKILNEQLNQYNPDQICKVYKTLQKSHEATLKWAKNKKQLEVPQFPNKNKNHLLSFLAS